MQSPISQFRVRSKRGRSAWRRTSNRRSETRITAKSDRSNKWGSLPCLPARQPHESLLRFWFVRAPTPAFGSECARRTLPELTLQD